MELRVTIELIGAPNHAKPISAAFATTVLTRRIVTDDEVRMQLEDILTEQSPKLVAVLMDDYVTIPKPDSVDEAPKPAETPEPAETVEAPAAPPVPAQGDGVPANAEPTNGATES